MLVWISSPANWSVIWNLSIIWNLSSDYCFIFFVVFWYFYVADCGVIVGRTRWYFASNHLVSYKYQCAVPSKSQNVRYFSIKKLLFLLKHSFIPFIPLPLHKILKIHLYYPKNTWKEEHMAQYFQRIGRIFLYCKSILMTK